jgi:L-asparaginase
VSELYAESAPNSDNSLPPSGTVEEKSLDMKPKRVLVLGTGGTISSVQTSVGRVPKLSIGEILEKVPACRGVEVEGIDLLKLDSTDLQPEDTIALASAAYVGVKEFDGVVITHGTDTMAFSSSMMSFMIQSLNRPIVFTGSMKGLDEDRSDAKSNLTRAMHVASKDVSGVFLVFGERIIRGCRATKVSPRRCEAFEGFPLIREVDGKLIPSDFRPGDMPVLNTKISTDVCVITMTPGLSVSAFSRMGSENTGIILQTFGTGGIPSGIRDYTEVIRDWLDQGKVIAITTQCYDKFVDLGAYEVGKRLLKLAEENEKGALVETFDMSLEAITAKMMWLLGQDRDPKEVALKMHHSYAGEITVEQKGLDLLSQPLIVSEGVA